MYNNMYYIIVSLILLFLMYKTRPIDNQIYIDGYQTTYFSPESKQFFDRLPAKKSKKDFAIMEDLFNRYEKLTVYGGVSHLRLATELDQQMKERFRGWDLGYHTRVLNQIAQPSKMIDQNLKC